MRNKITEITKNDDETRKMKIEHFSPIIDKTSVAYQHAKERE